MRESSGGVVQGQDDRIIIVEQHGNSWAFPKGGVEEGESLFEAAKREIKEETGITKLQFVSELGSYMRRSIGLDGKGETDKWPPSRRTMFLFRTDETTLAPYQDPHGEITQARWVTVEEALKLLTHPKDKEFLRSIRDILKG
jgi:8-oxo-dGTP pyrophosphatase MutT (NUDIX family)